MIHLIEYDRPSGRMVTFETFGETERLKAEDARLELELELHRRGVKHEVVILEAASEAALRRTHRRYFESLSEIARSGMDGDRLE